MQSPVVVRESAAERVGGEVDAAALAVAETPEQVINILKYVQNGELPL